LAPGARQSPGEGDPMTKTEPLDDSIESMGVTTAVSTMTAIVHDEYGTAPEDVLRLDEVDKPAIGDDEVLVRVHAAGRPPSGPPTDDPGPLGAVL
jgi:hypothetical protein